MIGFEILYHNKTISIAPEFGARVFVYQRNDRFYVCASGLEERQEGEMITHRWIDSGMELGESLEIKISEIEKTSDPIEKTIAFTNEIPLTENEIQEMLIEKLNDFYVMEKLLKDEGLL